MPYPVTEFVLLRFIGTGGGQSHLSETERAFVKYGLLGLGVILSSWGITVLIRYYFREKMIRRKMQWSFSKDKLWNYDSIIDAAKENYTKAQLLLGTNPSAFLKRLSPYSRARLRLFSKGVHSEKDIEFGPVYIVCFDDKRNDSNDSVAVYLEIVVKKQVKFREILLMHREFNEWKITEYVKDPTIFMISHARSIVEKS